MVSKSEIIKRLLEENINYLNNYTFVGGISFEDFVSIKFEKDKYFVYHKKDLILQGDLLKINTDYESQKRFILDVANEIAAWAEDYEEIDSEFFYNYLIKIDGDRYIDIIGDGDIFKNNYFSISTYLDEVDDDDERECIIDNYIDLLKDLLDECDHRAVLYNSYIEVGFYIDGAIRKIEIDIAYVDPEDIENLEDIKNIDDIIEYEYLLLYYKLNTYEQIEDALKSIF